MCPSAARYRPGTRPVTVVSSDGVRLAGIAVPAATPRPAGRPITFVVAHGFTNSVARPSFLRLAGWLSPVRRRARRGLPGARRVRGRVDGGWRPGDARPRRRRRRGP